MNEPEIESAPLSLGALIFLWSPLIFALALFVLDTFLESRKYQSPFAENLDFLTTLLMPPALCYAVIIIFSFAKPLSLWRRVVTGHALTIGLFVVAFLIPLGSGGGFLLNLDSVGMAIFAEFMSFKMQWVALFH